MIAAGKVGPTDAPGEKDVAGEEDLVIRGIKTQTPGTVAGNQKNAKKHSAKINFGCLLDQKIGLDRLRLEEETLVFEKIRIGDERNTIFMKSDLAFAERLEFSGVIEMVRMTMGQDQQIEPYAQIPDPVRCSGRSIDQNISSGRPNQVSVGIENTANKSLKLEHSEERFGNLD